MKTDVTVELWYSGAWNDVTSDVRVSDPITILRGRPNETSGVLPPPTRATLKFNNRAGRYSPRNPRSDLYGLIGRNTPVRITVDSDIRAVLEIESWPARWALGDKDAWVSVSAFGILRRLQAAGQNTPARSALYRAIMTDAVTPIAYWPLEGAATSTQLFDEIARYPTDQIDQSAAVPGQVGAVQFGVAELGECSDMVVDMAGSWSLILPITPPAAGTGAFAVQMVANWGTAIRSGYYLNLGVRLDPDHAAKHLFFALFVEDGGHGHLDIREYDAAMTLLSNVQQCTFELGNAIFDGRPHLFEIGGLATGGVNLTWHVKMDGVDLATPASYAASFSGPLDAGIWRAGILHTAPADQVVAVGHVAMYDVASGFGGHADAVSAYAGETAAARIERLCDEEGVPYVEVDITDGFGGVPVGVQRTATLVDLMADAVAADGGILFETRDALGLTYRTGDSLLNQETVVELDYTDGAQVAPPLEPIEDTDHVANDITMGRYLGGKLRLTATTGPLNTNDPADDPDGVGPYPSAPELVLYEDAQLDDAAGWALHLGTWDEARYPVIAVDVNALQEAGLPGYAVNAAAVDIGDRLEIVNPPAWLPPETIAVLVQGSTEIIGSHGRRIEFNAIPAGPYQVGVYGGEGVLGGPDRYESDGAELAADATTGAGTLSVATPAGPLWTTSASDFPFDILVGGERITVTSISGSTSPQTFTVTRSVNGIVKAHSSGAAIRLFQQARYAREAVAP